ncbi:MAG: hypothetical protein KGK30_10355, partial [Elusimicrobia bacterium]|nr:hypothetical protein [Elusimicrobiota bacterium]
MGKLPYGQRLAARLEREIAPPAAAATRSELERLLAMLRLTRGQAGSNQALSAQRGRALGAAADSIAMVWGDRGEPGPLPAVRRIQGGTTISAIPTPERLRDEDDSVALRPGDLQGRRQALLRRLLSGGWSGQAGDGQGAYASSVLGGPGGPGGSAGSMDSTGSMGLTAGEFSAAGVSASGAYAGKGFFSGGSFAAAGPALPAGAGAAGGPGSGNLHATVQNGRLSRMGAEQLQRGVRGLSNKLPVHGGLSPMKQLADGNVRSTIASAPDCSPANGCPPEYASTNTGAVYDGNPIGADDVGYLGSGAGVTGLDGVSTPDVTPPSETTLDGL